MKYARVVNDIALDVCESDPAELFHPDIATQFESVPDEVKRGWIKDTEGNWSAPESSEGNPAPGPRPTVTPIEFKLLWTGAERVSLQSLRESDTAINDFFQLIDDPRLNQVRLSLPSTHDGVSYCLAKLSEAGTIEAGDIEARKEQILSGKFQ